MSPVGWIVLWSWDWRIEVIATLLTAGALYLAGWRRLRALSGARHVTARLRGRMPLTARWRQASYLAGLLVLAVALMSPIDVLGSQLFVMHMVQHLLLVMVAPPLLLIATPFPVILWGLPKAGRRTVGRWFRRRSPLRRLLRGGATPGIVWFLYTAVYVGWHDPGLYNLALRNEWVHDLEHLSFFATAMLFWWHVTGVGPRFHRVLSTSRRLIYVISAVPANMLTGVAIAFAREPIYTYYTTVPRLYGLTVMQDQMLGGIVMWIPGSMMLLLVALVLISRMVQVEVDKPIQARPAWLVDDTLPTH